MDLSLIHIFIQAAKKMYEEKEEELAPEERVREIERVLMLQVVDRHWTEHIDIMDQMRQGIGLQAYAQKNPLDEYKLVSYDMFEELSMNIQEDTLKAMFHVHLAQNLSLIHIWSMITVQWASTEPSVAR